MAAVVASAVYTASRPLPFTLRESMSTDSSFPSSSESVTRSTCTPTTSPESAKHSPHMHFGTESKSPSRPPLPSRTSTLDLPPPLLEQTPVVLSPTRKHSRSRTTSNVSTSSLLRTTLRLSNSVSHTPIAASRRTSISSACPSGPQTPSTSISFTVDPIPIAGLSSDPTTALSNENLDSLAQFSPTPRANSTLSRFRVPPSSFDRNKTYGGRHTRSSSASPSLRSYRNKSPTHAKDSIYHNLSEQDNRSYSSPLAWLSSTISSDKSKPFARTQSLDTNNLTTPPSISRAHAPEILISVNERENATGLLVPSTSRNGLELNSDGGIVGTPRPPTYLVGQPGVDVKDGEVANVVVVEDYAESPISIEFGKAADLKGKGREWPRGGMMNPSISIELVKQRKPNANSRPAISTIFENQTSPSNYVEQRSPPSSTHMRKHNTMPSLTSSASTFANSPTYTSSSPAPPSFPISGPTTGIPIPPQLKAIERNSRLMRAKICCVQCGRVGPDFPRCPRCGESWCSRECRVAAAVRETAEAAESAGAGGAGGKPKHVCRSMTAAV